MAQLEIRAAVKEDAAAINDIYNHYVLHSTCTYQEQLETLESRQAWLARQGAKYPVIVAASDGLVIGWAAVSPFHGRSAFRHTVEDAVYVHPAHLRRGTGERLLNAVLNAAKDAGHHCVIAVIDSRQEASVALHVKLGFVESGRLREVGRKFGEWLDLVYLQRLFSTTCFQPAQSAQR